ncbi:hypothetical protein V493_03803 [Pseudogymnoascus sp. VKM F-4281 (FW-2241)]|nr:hypothetical protein V493_03803 [Pseudogymnoascus sp. VKM F-4281 (FW-2241)]
MADAPEVYRPVDQVPHTAGQTGPLHGGPRPDAEGLQVNSAYVENYNKLPYSDNPALGPQQQQYASPPLQYANPPLGQQQPYVNPPLGHQTQYAENQPGGFVQVAGDGPQLDEKARKKRICGLSVLVFWCLVVAAVLIVVGAVVGGVVGSQKSKDTKDTESAEGSDKGDDSLTTGITPTPTDISSTTATGTTATASASATLPFQDNVFYQLSNKYLTRDYALGIRIVNGARSRQLNMSLNGDNDGQFWQIKKVPDADDRYWLACLFLGKDYRLYVDPLDRVNPLMAEADDRVTGQQWNMLKESDGTWRISNVIGDRGAVLSTYSNTYNVFMSLKDDTGTIWTITETRKITEADDFS